MVGTVDDACPSDKFHGLHSSNSTDFLKKQLEDEIDNLYISKYKAKVSYTFHKLGQSDNDADCGDDENGKLRFQTNKLIDKLLSHLVSASIDFQGLIILHFIRMAKQEDLISPSDPPGDIVKVLSHILLFYVITDQVIELAIEAISGMDSKYLIAIIRNVRFYLKGKRDLWVDYNCDFTKVYERILLIMMNLPLPTLKSKRLRNNSVVKVKDKRVTIYRKIYQDCWILIFQRSDKVQLENDKIKIILGHLPEAVLPFLTNPFIIADTLLSSFYAVDDIECNVLSLVSLFHIATKGGISVEMETLYESKGFYHRLYDITCKLLYSDSITSTGLQGKILQLIKECVSSGMIPGIYAIKFVKKLVQLACFAPSHLAISLMALASSLFHRHIDSCKFLIHTPPHLAKLVRFHHKKSELETIDSPFDNHYSITKVTPSGLEDCLVTHGLDDIKPIPCLWELDLLSRHLDKNVATLASSFLLDMFPKKIFNPLLSCDPFFSLRKMIMSEISTPVDVKHDKSGSGGRLEQNKRFGKNDRLGKNKARGFSGGKKGGRSVKKDGKFSKGINNTGFN